MPYSSIRDLDLNGKRVFIRVDFNVPLQKNENGDMEITSDKAPASSSPLTWDAPRASRIRR